MNKKNECLLNYLNNLNEKENQEEILSTIHDFLQEKVDFTKGDWNNCIINQLSKDDKNKLICILKSFKTKKEEELETKKEFEKHTTRMFEIKTFGLKLIDFAYANQYADMGDMNDIGELEDELKLQFKEIFEVEE